MKTFIFVLVALVFSSLYSINNAQEFEVPMGYKSDMKDDYKKYEADILKAIEYLENTPLNENINKRSEVKSFLMAWTSGSPGITIILNPYVMDFCKVNKEFLIIFMGGWSKYYLENNYDNDELKGALAGIHSVIKVYKMGKGINEDSEVEDLIEMDDEGKLEEWLQDEID